MDTKDDILKGDLTFAFLGGRAGRGWLPNAKRRLYDLRGGFVTEHSPPKMDTPAQWRRQLPCLGQQGRGTLKYRGSPQPFRCPVGLQQELLAYIAPTASAGGRCAGGDNPRNL